MIFARLHERGILGINRRNIDFTSKWNRRKLYPLVDNKLQTKAMCSAAGIPVPRLLAKAEHHFELGALMTRLEELDDFVLKPARGAMGNGIMVILSHEGAVYQRSGGRRLSRSDVQYHASGIISGLYALGGQADMAMVEERLRVHPDLAPVVYQGVPDVRIIVYRGCPIMGMVRLPTRASAGRANLHQGAVGVGIDLAAGRMRSAIVRNRTITDHPDTGARLPGRRIPEFERTVEIAVAASDRTEMGYLGVDVVIDAELGPVVLEMNARPGLAIQLCNQAGLLPRIASVDRLGDDKREVAERLEISRELARAWGS